MKKTEPHICGNKGNGRLVGLDDLVGPFQPYDSMILYLTLSRLMTFSHLFSCSTFFKIYFYLKKEKHTNNVHSTISDIRVAGKLEAKMYQS